MAPSTSQTTFLRFPGIDIHQGGFVFCVKSSPSRLRSLLSLLLLTSCCCSLSSSRSLSESPAMARFVTCSNLTESSRRRPALWASLKKG
eukprot:Skav219235  [mRNA]  locus=scaffold1242:10519:16354:+ [translate_table: standard]